MCRTAVSRASLHVPTLAAKFKILSSPAFGKIGDAHVKAIHKYAEEHEIPVVYFDKKGKKKRNKKDDKEEIARL